MLTLQQKRALFVMGYYTAGRFDLWALAGGAKANIRVNVMSELQGKRVPQSQAGVNALKAAFYAIAQPAGDCDAHREESFIRWCAAQNVYGHFATLADVT